MSGATVRDLWQRKLDFLRTQEPITVDLDQKFKLREQIAEAEAELRKLDGTRIGETFTQKVAPTRLRHSAEKLIGREEELARLDAAWADPRTHVLTIVAFGGVGKTSLVAHWAAGLAPRGYDAAWYFDWSFYSQGTREQGGAAADQFINRALEFFGDAEMAASAASPWDKGARLAHLVAARSALLVLDGLEPLQYPPGPLAGDLRDPAVAALLKGLAQRNPGLCVVTTRERVTDLTPFRGSTAPELLLEHLSTPAGSELLRTLGVRGTESEIETLVKEVRGHALTLNLLGRYLVRAHGGDVRRRDQVRFEEADDTVQGGHAFKAMAAYERWLAPRVSRKRWWWPFSLRASRPENEAGARQLAILRLMGLFDRPADAACLNALRRPPAITGLTEPIVDVAEEDWNLAVAALGDCGLVSVPEAASGAIDAHPLIREYFAKQLRDHASTAWRQAHSRLYEHLRDSVEDRPDTLDGLQPLYQAVVHGCYANRHAEARQEIYRDRVLRGNEAYSTKQLGAVGADLGAAACFFDQLWTRVSPLIPLESHGWILNDAAFSLRALGRLAEALQPMRAGLALAVEQGDWNNAASAAGNLCELELTLGAIAAATLDAQEAVRNADRSDVQFKRTFTRTCLISALHQAGRVDEALTLLDQVEAMHAEHQPEYPLLYGLQGFYACEVLLAKPERTTWCCWMTSRSSMGQDRVTAEEVAICQDIENRAVKTHKWMQDNRGSILSVALEYLTLGSAQLYSSLLQQDLGIHALPALARQSAVNNHLDAAVHGFRRAGQIDYLPRGLLKRAWLRFFQGDHERAQADLNEAWEIAERGPMLLFQTDIHLHRARLFHTVKPYPWDSPLADLAAARTLIEECGYWRRKEELQDAEAAAKYW